MSLHPFHPKFNPFRKIKHKTCTMQKDKLKIFEQGWPGKDTICGWGSTMEHTVNIRHSLPKLIQEFNIRSIADIGCGDLFWMQHVDLKGAKYTGYDIYERSTWKDLRESNWDLRIADVTRDILPQVDLTIVRDVFIHLPNNLVLDALDNIKRYSTYLLATNFIRDEADDVMVNNFDRTQDPQMRHSKLDLIQPPFDMGKPILLIPEDYPFKSMCLWKMNNGL